MRRPAHRDKAAMNGAHTPETAGRMLRCDERAACRLPAAVDFLPATRGQDGRDTRTDPREQRRADRLSAVTGADNRV